jgi:hypothetical protein
VHKKKAKILTPDRRLKNKKNVLESYQEASQHSQHRKNFFLIDIGKCN